MVRRAEHQNLDRHTTLDLSLAIMIGGFLGARALHILWEAPNYYVARPLAILEIWRGGFVFFGGVIGGILATEWIFRKKQLERGPWQDLFAPVFALGYAIGRLSCLAAGCCYGRSTDLPWGIVFPQGLEATAGIPLHPTQIYAFLWELSLFFVLFRLEKKRPQRLTAPGSLFMIWLIGHGFGRLLMEHFRADERGSEIFGLSISSLISLVLIICGSIILYEKQKNWTLCTDSSKLK